MTKEEAQIVIGNIPIKPEVLDDCYDITEYQEAKAMAIKALEVVKVIEDAYMSELLKTPTERNVPISDPCDGCQYELNSTNGNPCYSCGKYKLTEQQPCEKSDMDELDELIEDFKWRASLEKELAKSSFAKDSFDFAEKHERNETKYNRVAELLKELKEYRSKDERGWK